jgi:hypothetical protein
MKKLIKFFINLNLGNKINNLLHWVVGIIIGVLISFILSFTDMPDNFFIKVFLCGLLSYVAMKTLGGQWEHVQYYEFGAEYSDKDVWRGILGGWIGVIIFNIF